MVVAGPFDPRRTPGALMSPWYRRRDLAHLHQLAVEPVCQGRGLGDRLVAACEDWARAQGYRAIALDTAEPAVHLRARYARLGYAEVDTAQWSGKRYRSLILVKPLSGAMPRADDPAHLDALADGRATAAPETLP